MDSSNRAAEKSNLPPVYLTVVSHNEEPDPHPDYLADREFYLRNRACLRQLALMLKAKSAILNFQSDWNYLLAVAEYDVGETVGDTGGKNIVRWLVEDLGFEADPHAHETKYNYADVAYLHTRLGVEPSHNVGGFLSKPPDNPQGWEQHRDGIYGWVYPEYFWRADNLWGPAVLQHEGAEDQYATGVWRPKDRYHFDTDDPTQRLVCIGSGYPNDFQGLHRLLAAVAAGTVPATGYYTMNTFVPQACIDDAYVERMAKEIDAIAAEVVQGRVIWSSLTQTAARWRGQWGARPFRLQCEQGLREST